jgi:hypothetical protein
MIIESVYIENFRCIKKAQLNCDELTVVIGYDPENMILEIEFQHGGVYQYFNVPESGYNGLNES